MASEPSGAVSVLKLGGSVLTNLSAYRDIANALAAAVAVDSARRIIAVVSAEFGHTDALAGEAEAIAPDPDAESLDLLWSTGELRSVALLTLALRAAGVTATGLNAHQTGLRTTDASESITFNLLALRAALGRHAVVVVPGFLATKRQALVTLGRGGSDLSAVLMAAALGAECVLIKDVDGYFTADPATHPEATRLDRLTYAQALAQAEAGCPLVQKQALDAARRAAISLVIRRIGGTGTVVSDWTQEA